MAQAGQAEKATRFREGHEGDGVLVLPNAWDAGSARVFEAEGFAAIGTTSAGVAFAAGRPDGGLGRAEMVDAVGRIAAAVEVPVSADIEAGFGDEAIAVGETVAAVIEAGAIGINLEDAARGDGPALVDLDEQRARIGAARDAAEDAGIELFVNARTDVFWLGLEGEELIETAIQRLSAYVDAGADGVFVPRLIDADGIRRVAEAVPAPLNVLAAPGMPPLAELRSLGARRLSMGSSPARAALALTRRIAAELHEDGASQAMEEATIPYPRRTASSDPMLPTCEFASAAELEQWLEANHAAGDGIWLKIAKKGSGVASVSYAEALTLALCFGWIDSQKKGFDEQFFLQRFTPRRPRGRWSRKNREEAESLIEAGRMRPAGLAEVEKAKEDGRWQAAYEGQRGAQVPEDLRRELDRNEPAREFFEALDSANRYAILYRLDEAKKPETRERRLRKFVTMLERGETIH